MSNPSSHVDRLFAPVATPAVDVASPFVTRFRRGESALGASTLAAPAVLLTQSSLMRNHLSVDT
jgi:hypothetical protein